MGAVMTEGGRAEPSLECSACGATADVVPVTYLSSTSEETAPFCPSCKAEYLGRKRVRVRVRRRRRRALPVRSGLGAMGWLFIVGGVVLLGVMLLLNPSRDTGGTETRKDQGPCIAGANGRICNQ
jgi:hypothetical protein